MKMQRAKEHLDSLEAAIRAFESPPDKPKPYRVTEKDDLERGECILKLEIDEPPLRLGIIAGDFISCLRSSLDWLAWQLATLEKPIPGKVSFPIWKENSADARAKIDGLNTGGIPIEAIAVIKELQPYNYGDAYRDTHLWRLETLWNIEKHRHIVIHSSIMELFFKAPKWVIYETEKFDDCYTVRFPLAAKQHVKLDPSRCRADVRFGNEEQSIILTVGELSDMYQFVSCEVIPRFARFFPQVPEIGQRKVALY